MLVDCFPFFNELELLEIRLETLAPIVDAFVLVEAAQTYSGKPKPLVFQQNKHHFARFNIRSVTIPAFPIAITNPWQREIYSRNSLAKGIEIEGLVNAGLKTAGINGTVLTPNALILLSDLDEIPHPDAVARCAETLPSEPPGTCYVFNQELFYYFVNCKTPEPWLGTRMTRWGDVGTMADFRARPGIEIKDGGWHFSYLGGADRIREKVEASIHTELDRTEFKGSDHIARCLAEGSDLFGRNMPFEFLAFAEAEAHNYPAFLTQNRERFSHLIAPCQDSGPADRLFRAAKSVPSDIHEHLDYLYRLASTVEHVTELGMRNGMSTSAFLCARPQRLVSYDLERSAAVATLEDAARAAGVSFEFRQEDVLSADLEPTDLLFVDTWHVEAQMREELRRHADKVRRYLVLHDTETFGQTGETKGHKGIWPAVAAFMKGNPHWRLLHHFFHNNGLTVFTRV